MQDQECQQLAVGTGHRLDPTLPHQPAQFQSVDDVAVMSQRQRLTVGLDQDRLRVLDARAAGRGVPRVANGANTGQRIDLVRAEDLVDPAHAERHPDPAVLQHSDARTLLSTVLQRHQPDQRRAADIGPLGPDAEDTARLPRLVVAWARRGRQRVGKFISEGRNLLILGQDAAQRLVGHLGRVAVDLLVEHGLLPPTRPDAPGVVVDHVGDEQVAIGVSSELDLEVDELHILLRPGGLQRLEDLSADVGEAVDLIRRRHAMGHDPIRVDEGVVIGVILEEELDHRRVESRPFRHLVALQVGAGGDASHHHLERNHVAAANDHLVSGGGVDEMGRDTGRAKKPENVARSVRPLSAPFPGNRSRRAPSPAVMSSLWTMTACAGSAGSA